MPQRVPAARPRTRLSAELRRSQLAEAAAQRFHRLGFHRVSMADVAATVGVTAPAIYRHYRNKDALLVAAIATGLDAVDAALGEATDGPFERALALLADVAVARRDLWILMQRDARHLGPQHRAQVDRRFGAIVHRFFDIVVRERRDISARDVHLLVAAVFAVYSSPAVHQPRTSPAHHARVLTAAASATCRIECDDLVRAASPADDPTPPSLSQDPDVSRSEMLLQTSIRLFHTHGYAAVSLDDIGADVGMAGPSIYHHFASKADLLVAAFTRATERLAARRQAAEHPPSLDQLVDDYVAFGMSERLLFGVYVREAADLPAEAGRRIRAGLDADVRAWTDALGRERPELSTIDLAILVNAARAIVHDFVRLERLQHDQGLAHRLTVIVRAVLNAPLPS